MELQTPRTKLTNFLEWHLTDSSHMLLKRTGSQGAIRCALEAEMIARMSFFHRVRGGKRNRNISLKESLSAAYFFNERVLAKQKILATH